MYRILEFGGAAAGYAGRLFLQAGCAVTRVDEAPVGKDVAARSLDLYLNTGKQRRLIDDPTDVSILMELSAQADVVVTDIAPARLDRLGWVNFPVSRVRVSISPFGLSGPYRDWQANSSTIQSLAGLTRIMGDPGREPLTLPFRLPEYQAAQHAYIGAMSVLLDDAVRVRDIEVSMLETVMSMSQFTTVLWTCRGELRERFGNGFSSAYPVCLYPCKDGWVCINIVESFWQPFTAMIDRPDLFDDERFAFNAARMRNRDELDVIITEAFSGRSMAELVQTGQREFRIPIGSLYSFDDLVNDPHLHVREFFQPVTTEGGRVYAPGNPWPQRPLESQPVMTTDPTGGLRASSVGTARDLRRATSAIVKGPLNGVRVLDLTHVWAGPLATRSLADLGADVLKVESGYARGPAVLPTTTGLFPNNDAGEEPWNRNGFLNKLNRNKKGISINLKEPRGRDLLLKLVAECDVVIENFSATAMKRLNLDYEVLKTANPDIIYVAMPGYGVSGPNSDFVAFGPSVEPMTGVGAIMGYSDAEPHVSAVALSDPIAGIGAAAAVVTALQRRCRTGEGAHLDLSLQEATVHMLGEQLIAHQLSGEPPAIIGNAHAEYAPHGIFRSRGEDEWVAIACPDEKSWVAFAELLGIDGDWRFSSAMKRLAHRHLLDEVISAWTKARDKMDITTELQSAGVCAGAVLSAEEFMSDPHNISRGYFVSLGGEHIEPVEYPGQPVIIDGVRHEGFMCCPRLGGDNEDVLTELLGMSAEQVRLLVEAGVLHDRPTI